MIESTGSVGPRNWRAQLLRARAERWARSLVGQVRAGALACPDTAPLAVLAAHRDLQGAPLDTKVAAVEVSYQLRLISSERRDRATSGSRPGP